MPTTALTIGPAHSILQNVMYALPARSVFVNSNAAVEASLDGSAWSALTGANTTGVQTSANFIRCPGSNAIVTCKARWPTP